MSELVHMLASISLEVSVFGFMGHLKGKSVLRIFDKHSNLKTKFGNKKSVI